MRARSHEEKLATAASRIIGDVELLLAELECHRPEVLEKRRPRKGAATNWGALVGMGVAAGLVGALLLLQRRGEHHAGSEPTRIPSTPPTTH